MAMPPNTRSTLARALALGALAACSVVPDASWPPAHDGEVEAVYRFADGVPRIFRVPHSDGDITVLSLEADPPVVTERFIDGERIWVAPPELDVLRVRCRYRLWGQGGGPTPPEVETAIAHRFPGAEIVADRPAPE